MSEFRAELTAAAIQWGSWPGTPVSARRNRVSDLIAQAVDLGAALVVLPRLSDCVVWGDDLPGGMPDYVRAAVEASAREDFFAGLAARYQVNLVHTIISRTGLGMTESTEWRSPGGAMAARTLRLHTATDPALCGGDEIIPVELSETCAGFVCGDDAWSPEQCRILALLGCDMLLSPQALRKPYRRWSQVAGLWQQVQQNQVFGIESCLVGGAFAGRSAILGPCDMRPGFSGYLAEATDESSDYVLTAVLARQDLIHARRSFAIFDHFNTDLYRQAPAVKTEGW